MVAAGPASDSATALLALLAKESSVEGLQGLCARVVQFLQPISTDLKTSSETASQAMVQAAKKFAPFLIQLVKQAFVRLSDTADSCGLEVLVQLAQVGVDGLEALRSALKGRPYEIEVQRYMLVRKLVSKQLYGRAAEQGWQLYGSLCRRLDQASELAGASACEAVPMLPQPDAQAADKEVVTLVIGTVLNLLLCTVEQCKGATAASEVHKLLQPVSSLGAWLRLLPGTEAAKHRDSIFRYLYKGALALGPGSAQTGPAKAAAVWSIHTSTIEACMASPSRSHMPQVCGKLCLGFPASDVVDLLSQYFTPCGGNDEQAEVLGVIDSLSVCHPVAARMFAELHMKRSAKDGLARLAGCYVAAINLQTPILQENGVACCQQHVQGALEAIEQLVAVPDSAAGAADCGSTVAHLAGLKALNALRKATAAANPPGDDDPSAAGWLQCAGGLACSLITALRAMPRLLLTSQRLEAASTAANHTKPSPSKGTSPSLASRYGYPAASALVIAAQLHASMITAEAEELAEGALATYEAACSLQAFSMFWTGGLAANLMLGDQQEQEQADGSQSTDSAATTSSSDGPALAPLKGSELHWMSSSMYNVGVALHAAGQTAMAIQPFAVAYQAAVAAAAVEEEPQVQHTRIFDASRKACTLADALHRTGSSRAALHNLVTAVGLFCELGFIESSMLQPLVLQHTQIQAAVLQSETAASSSSGCQPHGAGGSAPSGASTSRKRGARKLVMAQMTQTSSALQQQVAPAPVSLSVTLQDWQCAIPVAVQATVLEVQLKCLQQLTAEGAYPTAPAALQEAQLLDQLLDALYPKASQAAAHARILLMSAQSPCQHHSTEASLNLLQRAVHLLEDAIEGEEADQHGLACDCAMGNAMLALQLAQQAVHLQHAKVDPAPMQAEPDWLAVHQHAGRAVQLWEGVCDEEAASVGKAVCSCMLSAIPLMVDLAYLMGIQGRSNLQGRLCCTANWAATASLTDLDVDLAEVLANTPEACWLSLAISPHPVPAVLNLEGSGITQQLAWWPLSLAALCRSAGERGLDAAEMHELASSAAADKRRGPAVPLNRAMLHHLAAEADNRAGDTTTALYNASEALRMASSLYLLMAPKPAVSATSTDATLSQPVDGTADGSTGAAEGPASVATASGSVPTTLADADRPSLWRVCAQYLASLLQNGELFERAGVPDDALHVFKEGASLAQMMGAPLLAATFHGRIAEVHCNKHMWAPAHESLKAAQSAAAAAHEGCSPEAAAFIDVELIKVAALLNQLQGNTERALELYNDAVERTAAVLEAADGDLQLHWRVMDVLLQLRIAQATCHLEQGDEVSAAGLSCGAWEALGLSMQSVCEPAPTAISDHPVQEAATLLLQAALHAAALPDATSNSGSWRSAESHAVADGMSLWGCPATAADVAATTAAMCTPAPSKPPRTGGTGRKPAGTARRKQASTASAAAASLPGSSTGASELLAQYRLLLRAYMLSRGVPLLFRRAAAGLAEVCGVLGCLHAAAMFLHASLGATTRLQYSGIQEHKLHSLLRRAAATPAGDTAAPQGLEGLSRICSALLPDALLNEAPHSTSIHPPGLAATCPISLELYKLVHESVSVLDYSAKAYLEGILTALPADTAVCSVSLAPSLRSSCSNRRASAEDSIVVSRCRAGAVPVIVQLPAAGLSPPNSGRGGPASTSTSQAVQCTVLDELSSILEASADSMAAGNPVETPEQKGDWWRCRIALDGRMQALLLHMDHTWLGLWRCLLLGLPANTSCSHALQSAAAAFAIEQLQALGSDAAHTSPSAAALRELLTTLFLGSDQLSDEEARQGLEAVGRLGQTFGADGASTDSRLQGQVRALRSAYNAAVEASTQGSDTSGSPSAQHTSKPIPAINTATKAAPRRARQASSEEPETPACSTSMPAEAESVSAGNTSSEEDTCAATQPSMRTTRTATRSRASAAKTAQPARSRSRSTRASASGAAAVGTAAGNLDAEAAAKCVQSAQPGRSRSRSAKATDKAVESRVEAMEVDESSENNSSAANIIAVSAKQQGKATSMRSKSRAAPMAELLPGEAEPATPLPVAAPKFRPVSRLASMQAGSTSAAPSRMAIKQAASSIRQLEAEMDALAIIGTKRRTAGALAGLLTAVKPPKTAVRQQGSAKPAARAAQTAIKLPRSRFAMDLEAVSAGLPLASSRSSGSESAAGGSGRLVLGSGLARGDVVLVPDAALQALPWESMPSMRANRMYRMPSLACAAANVERQTQGMAGAPGSGTCDVDLGSTFYLLNPSGDLPSTQATFEAWFSGQPGWQGIAGAAPSAAALSEALQAHHMFIYFGHGGGEQYLPSRALRRLPACAAGLLMGCSSGRLAQHGRYEPGGPVLAYLLAGCPAAVANLWDVTDRDIDRFSSALLERWLPPDGASTCSDAALLGPDGMDGFAAYAPRCKANDGLWIGQTVASSRGACRLPCLIGAAPVCYGVPSRVKM